MDAGELVAGRFEIVSVAGSGGMGTVYRAIDREGDAAVAIKIVAGTVGWDASRFELEARVLRGLSHPGIVRYVAHGSAGTGVSFLAMEWLEGEDLSTRLARAGLKTTEALTLTTRVAEALGWAHERGIVHRDIKPSNLFLPDGSIERVKVLDFGVARLRRGDLNATRTGAVLGTPGYMAPEQARGQRDVDARADVFSLGCVLFECLTGRPLFAGHHVMALLAKILLEEPPRVSDLREGVPQALDDLVARLVSKSPDDRPPDARAVAAAIATLGHVQSAEEAPPSLQKQALTTGEQRYLSVVVAGIGHEELGDAGTAATVSTADAVGTVVRLRETVAAYGADVEPLADGSVVVILSGARAATDQAAQAARCALALRARLPTAPIALATGRGVMALRFPVGEVLERAAALVRDGASGDRRDVDAPQPIRIDDVTVGLLDARFDVAGGGDGLVLRGERAAADRTRTLLGKPTPFVGRDRELSTLRALFDECVEEPLARAVLVTAPAGYGKSRLRHEFIRAIASDEVGAPTARAQVWFGQGDALRAGSPFGMIAPAMKRMAGILDGELIHVRRQKLRARVARHLRGDDLTRVTEFLGELIGTGLPDDTSVQLYAAREDPLLMGDQMRRAWEDFLTAETAAGPLVLVLEDLHWGDLPSVKFVDAALRRLADRPLLVLAMGRPEVHVAFPELWAQRRVETIQLGELRKSGGDKLVKAVLGDTVSAETAAQIVERAAGNAFYLEELIRAVAAGGGDRLPESVLAMVQARLDSLEAEARRILRAASVFGQVFWRGAVTALLGGDGTASVTGDWLAALVDREILARLGSGRFPGEEEYTFRHGLVREAAYAMLTDADRALGHRLAAEWLEKAGETDPLALAEHHERGSRPALAIDWYRRAAEHALGGNDFTAATERAERGVRCGADGEALGLLRLVQADAASWGGGSSNTEAVTRGGEAMAALSPGSAGWFSAAGQVALAQGRLGEFEQLHGLSGEILAHLQTGGVSQAAVIAGAFAADQLFYCGRYELADALLSTIDARAAALVARLPAVGARVMSTRATRALVFGDPAEHFALRGTAARCFEEAGDLRLACKARASLGYGYLELGAYAEAETNLTEALAAAERMNLPQVVAAAKHNLGLALAHQGRPELGRAREREAVEAFRAVRNPRLEGGSRMYLALIHLQLGELDAALREALAAVEVLASTPPIRAYALAITSRVRLARGETAQALDSAREAMDLLESLGDIEEGETAVRLAQAEALHASGDIAGAGAAIAIARTRLLERAEKIRDATWRQSFLERVADHARTLELARKWAAP